MSVRKVSIICPTYKEEKFISGCIRSIEKQDYPKEDLEVFFVDGMSPDRTREIIQEAASRTKYIHLLDNPDRTVPYALNIGIREATGEVIIRIDGHCTYPKNYVSTLVKHLYELEADNVGGVWNTLPAKDTGICQAVAIVSSHPFGVGASQHKIGADHVMETDTVPFGCYRRDVFSRIGLFDEELTRNQDDEFNGRLLKAGGKIYLIPDVVINYTARDSFAKMRKMYYQYGLFKPLVNKKLGAPATLRQFVPVLFLLGIVLGAVVCVFSPAFRWVYAALACLYVLLCFSIGIKKAVGHKRPSLAILIPYAFFNTHISYGWGYLCGIFKILFKQPFNVKSNR